MGDAAEPSIAPCEAPCAVVLGGATAGYSIIQELHAFGVAPVHLMDRVPRSARRSLKIDSFTLLERGADALRDALLRLGERHDRVVLFPTLDDHLEDLETHYDALAGLCHLPFNRVNLRRCLDKIHQYQECERLGVPCPRTHFVCEPGDLDALDDMPLPLLVKPQEKTPLARPRLLEEREALPALKERVRYLASEFVPGPGSNVHAYVGLRTPDGRILNEWIGKKLSQYPNDLGVFASASNQCPEEVRELGRRLLEGMDLHGIAEPEFKQDPRDGRFKLMEVNLRSMGWVGVGFLSGVPLHYSQWLYATGRPVPRFEQERERDVRLIQLQSEVTNLLARDGYGPVFRSVFRGGDRRVLTYFDWRDPVPFLIQLRTTFDVVARHFLRRAPRADRGRPEAA